MSQNFFTLDGRQITYHPGGPNPGPWLVLASIGVAAAIAAVNAVAKAISGIPSFSIGISAVPIIAGILAAVGIAFILLGLVIWLQVRANARADKEKATKAKSKERSSREMPAEDPGAGKIIPFPFKKIG